jgi:hypothetical protein
MLHDLARLCGHVEPKSFGDSRILLQESSYYREWDKLDPECQIEILDRVRERRSYLETWLKVGNPARNWRKYVSSISSPA